MIHVAKMAQAGSKSFIRLRHKIQFLLRMKNQYFNTTNIFLVGVFFCFLGIIFLSSQSGWFTPSSRAIGKAPQVVNYPKWRYDAGLCVDDVLRHICIWAGGVRVREDIELTRLD